MLAQRRYHIFRIIKLMSLLIVIWTVNLFFCFSEYFKVLNNCFFDIRLMVFIIIIIVCFTLTCQWNFMFHFLSHLRCMSAFKSSVQWLKLSQKPQHLQSVWVSAEAYTLSFHIQGDPGEPMVWVPAQVCVKRQKTDAQLTGSQGKWILFLFV